VKDRRDGLLKAILSASMGIGTLPTLDRHGVLRHVDYASAVSGGGYAGCSLAANCHGTGHSKGQVSSFGTRIDRRRRMWLSGRAMPAKHFTSAPNLPASLAPNAFGLYDMHGNVWEWVEDCWNEFYLGAPHDGSPWLTGRCDARVLRGGSWCDPPRLVRAAARNRNSRQFRCNDYGFRVALSLES
jgi:formylglycine-generating enzyme required for sulfatase activity